MSSSLTGTVQIYGSPNTIKNGDSHHLVHTFSRAGNDVTYRDGAQVDSRLANGAGNLDTGSVWNIGQDPSGAYPEDGSVTLDELAVWRRALTAYEAYALYYAATNSNTSFTTPGTVALSLSTSRGKVTLSWQPGATLGTLFEADNPAGPWTPVGAYTPNYEITPTAAQNFYRLGFSE